MKQTFNGIKVRLLFIIIFLFPTKLCTLEDFAKDIELTEEEQSKILQQYEEEIKQKKSPKTTVVGENIIFNKKDVIDKAKSNKKNKEKQSKEKKSNSKINENKTSDDDLSKSNSLISLETSSSKSSTDDDWEKISDSDK